MNRWYSGFSEHYLRMIMHDVKPRDTAGIKWGNLIREWLNTIPNEDREYLKTFFKPQMGTTSEIIDGLPGGKYENWNRLFELEKSLAHYCGIL